jgi:hypothetical protein
VDSQDKHVILTMPSGATSPHGVAIAVVVTEIQAL